MASDTDTQTLDPTTDNAKPKPERKLTDCQCGCGEMSGGRYRPGHDARHVSQLVKATIGAKGNAKTKVAREVSALSEKLQAKYAASLARAEAAASAKPANPASE